MTFQKHQSKKSKPIFTPQDRLWRIAYPFFDEMRTKQANGSPMQTPRFDATVCAPKLSNDPNQCSNFRLLHSLAAEAAALAWPQNPWPIPGGQCKIEDGDVPFVFKTQPGQPPKVYDPAQYAWRNGNWTFEISSGSYRPSVAVMQDGRPFDVPCQTLNGRTFYKGGDYGRIHLNAFTYHHESGKFGVKFGFDTILFMQEGDPIGSSGPKSAANMFAGILPPVTTAPVAPVAPHYAPPAAPAAPAAPLYAPPSPPLAPAAPAYPTAPGPAAPPAPMAPPGYPAPAPSGLPPFPQPR